MVGGLACYNQRLLAHKLQDGGKEDGDGRRDHIRCRVLVGRVKMLLFHVVVLILFLHVSE